MKYAVLAGLLLALAGCASSGGRATMRGCDIGDSRPANPYGSVLVPPAPTPPAAEDDEGAE